MDIVTHVATGILLSTAFDDPTAKTLCIIGSVLPDVTVIPIYADALWKKRSLPEAIKMIHESNRPESPVPEIFFVAYRFAHSILPLAIVSVLAIVVANAPLIAFCLGYWSHLVWDIPTHTMRYACRPLYPISNFTWHGFGDWWKTRTGMGGVFAAWMMLFGAYFFLA